VKLLLDENLSDRIIPRIIDLYPESKHVKLLALIKTDDAVIWEYAKANNFTIVSKDSELLSTKLTPSSSTQVYLPSYWELFYIKNCTNFEGRL
jgi:predicted nuclease of predicted toxin-antitoxin system